MRIGILNLPFDANYGGNLQRYALVKVMQALGHDIEHIFLYYEPHLPYYKIPLLYAYRLFCKIIRGDRRPIRYERQLSVEKKNKVSKAYAFYQQHIPHTQRITKRSQLCELPYFDAYIVGSDQVWRKKMTKAFGYTTYFLSFVKDSTAKKVAYACSFGTDNNEYSNREIRHLAQLYKSFSKVSVREFDGVQLLKSYGCEFPGATVSLDPTFLLDKEDYERLIDDNYTEILGGDAFCYILDYSEKVQSQVSQIALEFGLSPFYLHYGETEIPSIEQWLRNFRDAKFIITDSYHGTVFSIIFRKPFINLANDFRGESRINTLRKIFGITDRILDYDQVDFSCFKQLRKESMDFLKTI